MSLNLIDRYQGTLASGYTSGATTLLITSATSTVGGAVLPSGPCYYFLNVRAEGANTTELFLVTNRSSTTLTVVGAQSSTAASNHASGAVITASIMTAGAYSQFETDVLTVNAAPDPAYQWFPPSAVTMVAGVSGRAQGDAFVVTDPADGLLTMFYFRNLAGSPFVETFYRKAATMEGMAGAAEVQITSLNFYHKFVVLVDEVGVPVQLGGTYHGYGVYFAGALSDKLVVHFTATTLTGTWTTASTVIPHGSSGTWDGYSTDTPYAIYSNNTGTIGTIRLWYMAAPNTSQIDFGLAERQMIATATDPDGPFTKNYVTAALSPTSGAAWDHGWIGGVQIRRRPNGTYVMVFNASNTRPVSNGDEPATSLIGFAYSASLDGPWTKDANNPYTSLSNLPARAVEATDIWRGHLVYDPVMSNWYLIYNTSTGGGGGELITFSRMNTYAWESLWSDVLAGTANLVHPMTTGVTVVPNSYVNVWPGKYRLRAQANLLADGGGTSPALNVAFLAMLNNANQIGGGPLAFVGSYAFENGDIISDWIYPVAAPGYFNWTVQVTAGSPPAGSSLRNLRINVEKIR